MKRFLSGKVVTNTAKDTSVVAINSWKTHPTFRKRYKTTSRYLVQNTGNIAQIGQTVTIAPCRPISKRKSWTIVVNPVVEVKPVKKTIKVTTKAKKGTE